jgi:hypothetical protein
MDTYYVNSNAQANGDHEVHKSTCSFLPELQHRVKLGVFTNCYDAVREAKKKYSTADGCAFCCPACHTS